MVKTEETAPQAPLTQHPELTVNILENGAIIGIAVNSITSINLFLNDETMHNFCKAWLESRVALKQQRDKQSKIHRLRD